MASDTDLERLLNDALQQQTATSEILRVISGSPTGLQAVFDTIARNVVRLCNGVHAGVFRFDGELIHLVAHHNFTPQALVEFERAYPMRPTRESLSARAILDRAVVHVPDIESDPDAAASHRLGRATGYRSVLSVPMLRDGLVIGGISVGRAEKGPFSDRHIDLVRTFADQAVIAIENVRLFTELQEKNRALTAAHAQVIEALEQQTATGEILRVISRSPTDIQPVLETIVEHAGRVCGAFDAIVFLVEGDRLVRTAHRGPVPITEGSLSLPIERDSASGVAVLECRTVHVEDLLASREFPRGRAIAERSGFRTAVSVPLVKERAAIGTLVARRTEMQPFTGQQLALLETFADQAVIAIENVRLFKELEARNAELTQALDRQTATADILRVISGSRTDLQPVFDAILQSAVHLCGALNGFIWRVEDGLRRQVSYAGVMSPEWEAIAQRTQAGPPTHESVSGWVQIEREALHVPDLEREERFPRSREMARAMGYRSLLAVPMLRNQDSLGAIVLHKAKPFDEGQIQLLRTFADQAVIAVENARLLTELQARTRELTHSVEELTALGDVGRALSSTLDLETVLQTIVRRANTLAGTSGCTIWEYDDAHEEFRLRVSHYADDRDAAILAAPDRVTTIRRGQGVTTQVVERRQPVQIPDITAAGAYESPIRGPLIEAGHHALLGVPLLSEDQVIGVLAVTRKTPGEFEPETVRLLSTFATQSALAIQNARLFHEIADKSRQLEAASRHKSEFLANMSHELRTPLNAIIGFSEVLAERMFGEVNAKQAEYLQDILESGRHLLSLINDILDLSKIEAGRMELEAADFHLPGAIDNALILVRERATRRGITLGRHIDAGLGTIHGDERKVKQVLLNLLSNALKFTPEGGRIDVRAALHAGWAEVSVADTGVGIAPEDQAAVFEEFRQVGTADKKVEGTGLGLALSRKFVELHGGRLWVESELGRGSTFTFTLPVN